MSFNMSFDDSSNEFYSLNQLDDNTKKNIIDIIRGAKSSQSDAAIIAQNGKIIGAYFSRPHVGSIEAMSVTKSIVSLGIGILYDAKLISLDDPIFRFYPEWRQGEKKLITVQHLLTHTSGIQADPTTKEIYAAPDFVKLALAAELSNHPGEIFFYNNKAINLLAGLFKKLSGLPMDHFIEITLFKPLGITDFTWMKDSAGNPHGMAGLQIKAEDLLKIGELVLHHGIWNGKRIISAEWIRLSMNPEPLSNRLANGINYMCGLLWWVKTQPTMYFAEGYLGQYLVIIPEKNIVVVRQMHASQNMQTNTFPDFFNLVTQLAA
ncbi:serine hydrolase domain-containing protein [Fluoribacter gormanii]|uniref:Beta-lactamase n=1 Tax=Fluoribacter gormanii TaxID=464 RepID=A0A377GH76_9GAMM|nr:serine hydrolase [Fluoribacter gormanii]KTD02163.1 putative penicillin-binding protein PbpX [Fluoribacter gormanii]MCW8444349.1 beta-lactamase family protein [Fluoribacter gormanii]SIR51838.1 Beta-lactamase [Fluoribacter gormanii]STO24131.1 Beta-lactamase precursor [Fluoribacter gormanii]